MINYSAIGKRFGTPFYLYDLTNVRKKLASLDQAFRGKAEMHYAMKANANLAILSEVKRAGAGVDTVSAGEIRLALKAGFEPSKIIFSGVGKTEDEIRLALSKGIKSINVESIPELERIIRLVKRNEVAKVSFRLNPNVQAKTHRYIATGSHENKFGLSLDDFSYVFELLKKCSISGGHKRVQVEAVAFHIGSQLFDVGPVLRALRQALPLYKEFQAQGFHPTSLDIGGGLGVPYQAKETAPDVNVFAKKVLETVRPVGARLWLEPGRFVVAESGVLVGEVQYIKKTGGREFAVLNTGMHHLIRPALYEAWHEIEKVGTSEKARSQTAASGKKLKKYDIVGPICESADFLGERRLLPELREGDLLAIRNAGAYGFSMASHYNLQKLPVEIAVSGSRIFKTKSAFK